MSEGTAREIVARALFSRAALVDPDSDATREQFGADGVSHLMESYGRDADAVIAALAQAGALAPANPCPYCGRCLTAEPDAHARCMAQAEHDWIGDGVIVGVLAPAGLTDEQREALEYALAILKGHIRRLPPEHRDDAKRYFETLRLIVAPAADAATGEPS